MTKDNAAFEYFRNFKKDIKNVIGQEQVTEGPLHAVSAGYSQQQVNQQVAQQSVASQPVTQPVSQPVSQPVAQPVVQEIPVAQPVSQQPISQPVVQQAVQETPVSQPVVQQPVVSQPVTQQPVTQQPVESENVVHQPIVQEPVTQPVVQEPVTQPVVQEPIVQESVTQQVTQPVTQQVTQPVTQDPNVQKVSVIQPVQPQMDLAHMDLLGNPTLPVDKERLSNSPSVMSLINKCSNKQAWNISLEVVFDNIRLEINADDITDAVIQFRIQCTESLLSRYTGSICISYKEKLNLFSSKVDSEFYNELSIKNYITFAPSKVTVGEAIKLIFSRVGLNYLLN